MLKCLLFFSGAPFLFENERYRGKIFMTKFFARPFRPRKVSQRILDFHDQICLFFVCLFVLTCQQERIESSSSHKEPSKYRYLIHNLISEFFGMFAFPKSTLLNIHTITKDNKQT